MPLKDAGYRWTALDAAKERFVQVPRPTPQNPSLPSGGFRCLVLFANGFASVTLARSRQQVLAGVPEAFAKPFGVRSSSRGGHTRGARSAPRVVPFGPSACKHGTGIASAVLQRGYGPKRGLSRVRNSIHPSSAPSRQLWLGTFQSMDCDRSRFPLRSTS